MIRTIIEALIWIKNLDNSWSFVTNITTIISCLAGIATLAFAIITYQISKISKEIGLESKQVAIESKELAERAYNLEHDEPWKLTPIIGKKGYWILEKVRPQSSTIYRCWAWTNPPIQMVNETQGIRPDKRLEVKFVDYGEGASRTFFRGTKVLVKIPKVPTGSVLHLYYYDHSSFEEAHQKKNYKNSFETNREMQASGTKFWETPLY